MTKRKSLSDILRNGQQESLRDAWDSTKAAEEFKRLPAGEYIARLETGELFNSESNATPGYKLGFRVLEGDHTGRRFWSDYWLTEAALPWTKRELAKVGVTSIEQLERPLPEGIVCKAKVVIRKDDDGSPEFNKVKSFEVLRIEAPEADPFAPGDSAPQAGAEA